MQNNPNDDTQQEKKTTKYANIKSIGKVFLGEIRQHISDTTFGKIFLWLFATLVAIIIAITLSSNWGLIISITIAIIVIYVDIFLYQFAKHFNALKQKIIIYIICLILLFMSYLSFRLLQSTTPNDYLNKNRAYLNCSMYIDNIKGDSIFYHLEVQNRNPIPARNITYFLQSNGESESEIKELASEMGQGDALTIYPIANVVEGIVIGNNSLTVNLSIYYDSIWDTDTLHHTDKFSFIIPQKMIGIKKFEPTNKEVVQIASFLENLSIATLNQLNENEGNIYLVWDEKKQPLTNSIYYLISTDSIALVYLPQSQQIIFQRLLANGKVINLAKQLTPHKRHILTFSWSGNNYSISADNDSTIASTSRVGNALVAIIVNGIIWIGIDSEIGNTTNVLPPLGDIIKTDSMVFAYSERAGFPVNVDIRNIFRTCFSTNNVNNLAKCFIHDLGLQFQFRELISSNGMVEVGDTLYRLNVFYVTNSMRYPVLYHILYSFVNDSVLSPTYYKIKIHPYPLVYVADKKSAVTVSAKIFQTSINIMNYIKPFFSRLKTIDIAELIEGAFEHESITNHSMGKGISIIRITRDGFDWIKKNQQY